MIGQALDASVSLLGVAVVYVDMAVAVEPHLIDVLERCHSTWVHVRLGIFNRGEFQLVWDLLVLNAPFAELDEI
jgi:hypothetical protein